MTRYGRTVICRGDASDRLNLGTFPTVARSSRSLSCWVSNSCARCTLWQPAVSLKCARTRLTMRYPKVGSRGASTSGAINSGGRFRGAAVVAFAEAVMPLLRIMLISWGESRGKENGRVETELGRAARGWSAQEDSCK